MREYNEVMGRVYTYVYDNSGNITQKRNWDIDSGEEYTSTVPYEYSTSEWGDLLTSYNGRAITY